MATIFPPEPTLEPIRDRAATADDCAAGRAAFAAAASSPELANEPLDTFLPRIASVESKEGDNTVVLIQAERAQHPNDLVVFGYQDRDGSFGACTADEIMPWPCFFVFFDDAKIQLDTIEAKMEDYFTRNGSTLATKPFDENDPIMFVRRESGPHVQHLAASVAAGSEYETAMANCGDCFVVCFEDLEQALDEINTLIDLQFRLGDLTQGFVYLEWNESLTAAE